MAVDATRYKSQEIIRSTIFGPRRRWIFILEACVVVTLLGFLTSLPGGPQGWIGVAAIAFFLPGVPIALLQIVKSRPVARTRDSFVVRRAQWTAVSYVFLCGGWICGLLILMVHRPEVSIVARPLIALCTVGLVVSLGLFVDTRPLLVIDDKGFFDRSLGLGTIPWSEITGASITSQNGTNVISLELRDPAVLLSRISPARQFLNRVHQYVGFELLHLGLVSLDAAYIDEALDFILARCAGTPVEAASFDDVLELSETRSKANHE